MRSPVAAVAAISGFLFGYDEGVVAGALADLHEQFQLTPATEGMMVAAVPLGALAGALVSGRLADAHGRRPVLIGVAIGFSAGAVLAGLAPTIWVLTLARLLLGAAIGISSMVAPLYIAETAPPERRGALVSYYQLAITAGILVSYLGALALENPQEWRWLFGAGLVPAAALLAGVLAMPESPRWLVLRGRASEAVAVLVRLRGDAAAGEREAEAIRSAVAEETGRAGVAALLQPLLRPALVIGMGLFMLQQLSGINSVINYAPQIFDEVGFGSRSATILATIGIGAVNFGTTFLALWLVDRLGRRPLILFGFAGTAVSLAVLALAAGSDSDVVDVIALAALVAYIFCFAISIGPLPYLLMSEVFPLAVRGPGMSLASATNWGFNALVVFTFPTLLASLGLSGTFWIYAVVCLCGLAFAWRRVPETKGIALERIEHALMSGRPLREVGRDA